MPPNSSGCSDAAQLTEPITRNADNPGDFRVKKTSKRHTVQRRRWHCYCSMHYGTSQFSFHLTAVRERCSSEEVHSSSISNVSKVQGKRCSGCLLSLLLWGTKDFRNYSYEKPISSSHWGTKQEQVTGQEALPVCGCLPKRVKRHDGNNSN